MFVCEEQQTVSTAVEFLAVFDESLVHYFCSRCRCNQSLSDLHFSMTQSNKPLHGS